MVRESFALSASRKTLRVFRTISLPVRASLRTRARARATAHLLSESETLSALLGEFRRMPVIECDPARAAERLETAGVTIETGNTDHERWRATHEGATAVAYEGKVVIQGEDPVRLEALLRETGRRAHCYFDGASRGNPGPAAIGWVIVTSDGIVTEGGARIDDTTNNRAEYEALIHVLEIARDYGFSTVEVRGDSQLVVEQVRGAWQTNNPALRERRVRVRELLTEFDEWSIDHVPREANERADELADDAFDD